MTEMLVMKKILYIGQNNLKQELFNIIADRNIYVFDPENIGSAKIIMRKTQLDFIIVESESGKLVYGNMLNDIFNSLNHQSLPVLIVHNINGKLVITNIWNSSETKCTHLFEGEMYFSEYLNKIN